MNIAQVTTPSDGNWVKLEDLIKQVKAGFSFNSDTLYSIQNDGVTILLCESSTEPTKDVGAFPLTPGEIPVMYEVGVAPLYVKGTIGFNMVLNIGDNT